MKQHHEVAICLLKDVHSRPKTRRLLPLRPTATCSQLSLREQKPLSPIGRETTPPAFFPIILEVAAGAATGHSARAPPTSGRATRNPRLAPYVAYHEVLPALTDACPKGLAAFVPATSARVNPTLTPTPVPAFPEVVAGALKGPGLPAPPTLQVAGLNPNLTSTSDRFLPEVVAGASKGPGLLAPRTSRAVHRSPILTPTPVRACSEVVAGATKGPGLLAPPSLSDSRLAPLPPGVAWFSSFPEKRPLPPTKAGEVQPLSSQCSLTRSHDLPFAEVRDALLPACKGPSRGAESAPPLSVTNSRSPHGAEKGSSTSAAAASLEDDDTPLDSSTGQCSLTLSHNLHSEVRGSPLTTGRYPCAASGDTAPEKSLTFGVSSDVATRGSSTSVATAFLEEDDKPDTSTASPEIRAPRPHAALRRGRRSSSRIHPLSQLQPGGEGGLSRVKWLRVETYGKEEIKMAYSSD
ncbi:hypothetical protein CAPTEDRAFT_194930 [Capitella teleta]|uniref:Uncharacterized protein n=1 Tax=Capitella teleta TaxID=283909 RepID=R7VKY9_CAPTE|nr:hypothetical protein CAPTEDRAFT_194930 [Capitella teleta]|eukprot:ELU17801.1 hypothetical protein CAPTEDRAFT_194930 [Capitella teleta]